MFTFLLVLHAIIAAALVTVILMQRSEGGGLGMGGSPTGLMSARGAADFLTRATTILAALFVGMCILLATLASLRSTGGDIDTSLARQPAGPAQSLPTGNTAAPVTAPQPAPTDPLAGAAAPATPATNTVAPAPVRPAAPRATPRSTDPVAPARNATPSNNTTAPAPTPRVTPPVVVPVTPPAANNGSTNPSN
jgi:preprotein translocase subunit SecG